MFGSQRDDPVLGSTRDDLTLHNTGDDLSLGGTGDDLGLGSTGDGHVLPKQRKWQQRPQEQKRQSLDHTVREAVTPVAVGKPSLYPGAKETCRTRIFPPLAKKYPSTFNLLK